jgi:hypothetical protein
MCVCLRACACALNNKILKLCSCHITHLNHCHFYVQITKCLGLEKIFVNKLFFPLNPSLLTTYEQMLSSCLRQSRTFHWLYSFFFEICDIFNYLFVISSPLSFVEKIISSLLLLPMSEFKMISPTLLHFALYLCSLQTHPDLRNNYCLNDTMEFEFFLIRKCVHAWWTARDEVTREWRRLNNDELYAPYSSPDIIRVMKSRTLGWAGRIACMGGEWYVQGFGGGSEVTSIFGRTRRRWEDDIKIDL